MAPALYNRRRRRELPIPASIPENQPSSSGTVRLDVLGSLVRNEPEREEENPSDASIDFMVDPVDTSNDDSPASSQHQPEQKSGIVSIRRISHRSDYLDNILNASQDIRDDVNPPDEPGKDRYRSARRGFI